MSRLWTLLLLGFVFSPALAQDKTAVVSSTAYDIRERCQVYGKVSAQIRENNGPVRPQDALDHGFCVGYIIGVGDALSSARTVCIPSGVQNAAVTEVVLKYFNDHPEELHLAAASVVSEALQKAYPCGH